jgi:predicted nucleic acid-binding protein
VTILDTNVISGLMQASPNAAVIAWLDQQAPDELWITSVTVYELRLGLALLPTGKRRRALEEALVMLLRDDLEHRVVDFDAAAATTAAALTAARQKRGRPVDLRDTQIAGIVLARRATLATRNVNHFTDLDIPVVNPWGQ